MATRTHTQCSHTAAPAHAQPLAQPWVARLCSVPPLLLPAASLAPCPLFLLIFSLALYSQADEKLSAANESLNITRQQKNEQDARYRSAPPPSFPPTHPHTLLSHSLSHSAPPPPPPLSEEEEEAHKAAR